MKLSKRLESCARFTDGFHNLADIGTDHALLPITCVKNGYVFKAQAIDNKEGPYVIAFSNVRKNNMQDKISVVKADGISEIEEDTDVVVISGMGGELIRDIITKDDRKKVKRFILQPNNNAEAIRAVLKDIQYRIIDELVLEDQNKIYDILVIEPGDSNYSDLEIQFGPVNLVHKPFYYQKRIAGELCKLNSVLDNIPNKDEKDKVAKRIDILKEVLR
jgi:tRNA (adenine22-N1)-methyltransferase